MSSLLARLDGEARSKQWIRHHLDYPHKDFCLIWPFSRIQSGYACFGRPAVAVHRLMCEHRNGPAPSPQHHAAHSCGRGHEGCVNPMHLDWKTISENQVERYQHSGLTRRAKLTPEDVDQILALKGRARIADIARQFGVSDTNIRSIHAGRLWKQTSTLTQRMFTEDEVRLIRSTSYEEKTAKQWAEEFGVGRSVIERIRSRKSYKWVDENAAPLVLVTSKVRGEDAK